MPDVAKRSGKVVPYDPRKVQNAILCAMRETFRGIDVDLAGYIASSIGSSMVSDRVVSVEYVQDRIIECLMESKRIDVAERYSAYRSKRDNTRNMRQGKYRLLDDDFISPYKKEIPPMDDLGVFVFYRTYSRWLPEEGRREFWWETVRRAVEYNCSLDPHCTAEEAKALFINVFYLRQFLSGRTFWVGGTEVAEKFPMANYNCAFECVDSIEALRDLFYLLMIGSGVGVSITKDVVAKLPRFRTDLHLESMPYNHNLSIKSDVTGLEAVKGFRSMIINVGDSKEGWVMALYHYLDILTNPMYREVKEIWIDYSHVRPKGSRLKTFGGTASGHESLESMFRKIHRIISNIPDGKARPIDIMDICNIIGENVVVGGVRRTSEICLIDKDDTECLNAKNALYVEKDGRWEANLDIIHRSMSNNTVIYNEKPSFEELKDHLDKIRYSGEPGFLNMEAARKRSPKTQGVNPCAEILLQDKGMCNLTTLNVNAFYTQHPEDDEFGFGIRWNDLWDAQRLSARAAFRMTLVDLELPKWDAVQKSRRLTGCSLTGWYDMVDKTGMDKEYQVSVLCELREIAERSVVEYAQNLGVTFDDECTMDMITTIKPEGTLSRLPGVSSGVHRSFAPYYIRRVRVNSSDPLAKACISLGYPVKPEVGQGSLEECNTMVVEFPCKSDAKIPQHEVSAIEQLETYRMFMDNYVEHNASITVSVGDDEWKDVLDWLWKNWDDTVALSFISRDNSFYDLMPYEEITESEYLRRKDSMPPFLPSVVAEYELEMTEHELDTTDGCENGICPVR